MSRELTVKCDKCRQPLTAANGRRVDVSMVDAYADDIEHQTVGARVWNVDLCVSCRTEFRKWLAAAAG